MISNTSPTLHFKTSQILPITSKLTGNSLLILAIVEAAILAFSIRSFLAFCYQLTIFKACCSCISF